MKKKLRLKILAGALGLVLMVSLISTGVVSVLVNHQNRNAVNVSLQKSLSIVRDALMERQEAQLADIRQMISVNKVAENTKFINDFGGGDIYIALWAYQEVAKTLLNRGMTSDLSRISIYDMKGRLQTFGAVNKNGEFVMGFHAQNKFHFAVMDETKKNQDEAWQEEAQVEGLTLATTFDRSVPAGESTWFARRDKHISIHSIIPIVANTEETGEETNTLSGQQLGIVVAEKEIKTDFIERMNRLTGMGIQLFADTQLSLGTFPDYEKIDIGALANPPSGQWDLRDQTFTLNDLELGENHFYQAVLPLYSAKGYIGAVTALQSDEVIKANNRQMVIMLSLVSVACMLLVVPLAFVFSGKIVRPVITIVERLRDIAEGEGDLTKRLEVRSVDEIGQVAEWFNTFIEKIHAMIRNVAQYAHELNDSSSSLEQISHVMARGADQTSAKSNAVAAAGEEMSVNMTSVAAAMEEAATNVGMVASSAEEMSNTINEISQNTIKARDITSDAVNQAGDASEQVGELGNAANDIGKVIETITEISEQVNLLALNATIEAARAGEAGKGFAVVANEIKELANQTAAATSEIKMKVQGIRSTTGKTVDQINSITAVVNNINEIVLIIASAVEEQSATTQHIAENVSHAAKGIDEVNSNIAQSSSVAQDIAKEIEEVNMTADEMSSNSAQVNERSAQLSKLAQDLNEMVDLFKI